MIAPCPDGGYGQSHASNEPVHQIFLKPDEHRRRGGSAPLRHPVPASQGAGGGRRERSRPGSTAAGSELKASVDPMAAQCSGLASLAWLPRRSMSSPICARPCVPVTIRPLPSQPRIEATAPATQRGRCPVRERASTTTSKDVAGSVNHAMLLDAVLRGMMAILAQ